MGATRPLCTVGRYAIYDQLAAGSMGAVHFGRFMGPGQFGRTVVVKRIHPHLVRDPEFVSMFLDEARLTSRVRHANVVQTLDVVADADETFVVMEYIHGVALSLVLRASCERDERIPPAIGVAVMIGVLGGLHAAHEARNEVGQPLGIIHRDVSPQNILIGADGVARVIDFGVAKAKSRAQTTRDGRIKGKLSYMAPEHLFANATQQSDIFSAAIVLWEVLTGNALFRGESEAEILSKAMMLAIPPPSSLVPELSHLDAVVMRGLSRDLADRFATAREMAMALERVIRPASAAEIALWLEQLVGNQLANRAQRLLEIESSSMEAPASESRAPSNIAPSEGPSMPAHEPLPMQLQATVRADLPRRMFTRGHVLAAIAALGASSLLALGLHTRATHTPVAADQRVLSTSSPGPSVSPAAPSALSVPSASSPSSPFADSADAAPSRFTAVPLPSSGSSAHASSSPSPARSLKRPKCAEATYVDSLGRVRFREGCL